MRAPTFSTLLLSSSLAILVSLPGCVKAENVPVADFCTTITTEEACNEYMSSESVAGTFCTWYDQKCVASVPCQTFDDNKALCIGNGGFYYGSPASTWTQWCYYNDITKHCMDFTNHCENIVPVTDGTTPNALDETACNAVRGCSYTSSDLENGERQFSCKQFNKCPGTVPPFGPAVPAGEGVEAVSQDECESLPNCAYDESLSICYNPGPALDGCNAIASRDECKAEGCVWTEITETCGDDFNCAAFSLDPPGCTQAGCELNDLELNGIDLALCQIGPDGSPNVTDPLCPENFAGRENGAEFSSKIENACQGTKPTEGFANFECIVDGVIKAAEQAGANVTAGYQGLLDTDAVPQMKPYWQVGMCPVNVHVHSGTEHYSYGEYDEDGTGPTPSSYADEVSNGRKLLAGNVRTGYQCHYYDSEDPMFTTEYDWKFCSNFKVGQTYEVHWPHSAAGACGTPDQYQFPFYDGVFCFASVLSDTAAQIGVQAQVFTLVNDESYYYGNLFGGMIVDDKHGQKMAYYTGSTTGTTRDNEICSAYAPITWQVDRECHLISASSFDKLCADMISMKDDMGADTVPHGSRILVADDLAANNLVTTTRGFRPHSASGGV